MVGIIFDVDGTLWDSTEQVAVSWNRALREHSELDTVLTADDLKKEFGKPVEIIMEDLFPALQNAEREELADYLFQYENEWVNTAPCIIFDQMQETVKALAEKYPLFIVSNCQAGYIEAFLNNTGLGSYFVDFTCPGDTGKLKGENIRIIMERNGIDQAVYVGDTQGDATACREAGIPMVFAAYGFGDVKEEHICVQSFGELLELDYNRIVYEYEREE